MTRFPFTSYPKSWFKIAFSKEVKKGKIKTVKYLGRELIVFRGENNEALVAGAHCPHLGAHLGVGGKVAGNNIVCPFHGWKFNAKGECVEIPYCKKIPVKSNLASWRTREVNGVIFAYFDGEGGAPEFEPPIIEEYGTKEWTRYHKLHWIARTHIQEIAENAVDLPHFAQLHDYRDVPIPHEIKTSAHNLHVSVDSTRRILGRIATSNLSITYHGMGCVVARVVSDAVSLIAFLTPTPIDDEMLNINLSIILKKKNPIFDAVIHPIIISTIKKEFDRDVHVWESKAYLSRPSLCAEDGPVMKVRKWAQQFYLAPAT